MIIIVGHLVVAETDRSTFIDAHRDLLSRGRAYPGCVHLSISADPLDPRRINNAEVWESPEALAAWRSVANAPDTGVPILDADMRKCDATDAGPVF